MTWWNDTGVHGGGPGYLLAGVMLLGFWGIVIAALTALLGTTRSQPRRDAETAQRLGAVRPATTAALGAVTATAPLQHR